MACNRRRCHEPERSHVPIPVIGKTLPCRVLVAVAPVLDETGTYESAAQGSLPTHENQKNEEQKTAHAGTCRLAGTPRLTGRLHRSYLRSRRKDAFGLHTH